MEAERWRRIEALCQAALEQPPEKRPAFLAQACPDDPQLRGEVQALLDQQADSFLESAPVSAVRALSAGAKLGNFEIVELLGRGGMGEVWRARDARLKRDVAIKVLAAALARDPDRTARFEREARAAGALNHPNILSIYDIGRDNGTCWIATELVRGDTLRRMIEVGPLPAPKAIEIATQVAAGLAAAHAAGLVHRDLKPDNIMVTRDGHVKILDFGLAKQRHTSQGSTTVDLTDEGVVLGTVGYMSPEQVRGEAADHRSDLFSFGVVLYEMLCGRRAFVGGSSVEVMNAVLKEEPAVLPASVPPALALIVHRCLEKERERRWQSTPDLGFALRSLAASPSQAPLRRAWWKWAAPLAACAIAVAAYWMGVRAPKSTAAPELTFHRLTNDLGLATDAAISPDGKLVAYVRNGHIWVQQVDGGSAIQVTDDPANDSDPVFSADGTQVAFRSERADGGIYIAPALGGDARELVPQGHQPLFSPDGRWLMYWIGPEPSDPAWRETRLFIQPMSGGAPTQVGDKCWLRGTGAWSPDGSRVLFLAECGNGVATTWVFTLEGRDLKPNRDVPAVPFDQWIANPPRLLGRQTVGDATYIAAFPISADGTKAAGPPQKLTPFADNVTHLSAALNGRMACSVSAIASHIWGLPIDRRGQATGEPKQLTHGFAGEGQPSLSADGGKMAFISRANGGRLFYRDLATGRERQLSTEWGQAAPVFNSGGAEVTYLQWQHTGDLKIFAVPLSGLQRMVWDKTAWSWLWDRSPDGNTVLLSTSDDPKKANGGAIEQLELDVHATAKFLEAPELELWQAHFSHDGRWVTFNATKGLKSSQIYVAPFRKALVPRNEWIAITNGNWDDKPRFSFDADLVFFVSERDHRIMAQRLGSDMRPHGKPFEVYPSGRVTGSPAVSGDEISAGPDLIVFTHEEATGNVWLLEPAKRDAH